MRKQRTVLKRGGSACGSIADMNWTIWALLLIAHGAFTRWVQAMPRHPLVTTANDVLLIAIGLLTVSQLQGLAGPDILRVGIFFVAFGYSGRRLTSTLLARSA